MTMNLLKPCTFLTFLTLSMLMLGACSSQIPTEIKQSAKDAPDMQKVHLNPDQYIGHKVRRGGTILQTENKQDTSWISVVGFPLNSYGRPLQSTNSTGRFIASVDEFLEPIVYTNDRQIAFSGTFIRTESRKVGEFSYDYPVIKVEHYYLWPVVTTPETNHLPYWWYDPWYYPGHPYYLRPTP